MPAGGLDLFALSQELARELENQTDRGLVILGASALDVMLEEVLDAYLYQGVKREALFGSHGPLATFSARIKLAHAMGIISADEYADLENIRKIRNIMAHALSGASFINDAVRDKSMNLLLGERLYAPDFIPLHVETADQKKQKDGKCISPDVPTVSLVLPDAQNPRLRFAETVKVLLRILWHVALMRFCQRLRARRSFLGRTSRWRWD